MRVVVHRHRLFPFFFTPFVILPTFSVHMHGDFRRLWKNNGTTVRLECKDKTATVAKQHVRNHSTGDIT